MGIYIFNVEDKTDVKLINSIFTGGHAEGLKLSKK